MVATAGKPAPGRLGRLTAYWGTRNWVSTLLLPLAWLYCALVLLRRACYRFGMLRTNRVGATVVVVGNITVGGTGKTPLVLALADLLRRQGHRVGIISRGYGGRAGKTAPLQVSRESSPAEVGDEPLLLARRCQCPVVVGRDRVAAARALLSVVPCDIILSDDGLQHYALDRQVEIAVVDGTRRFGNGRCLPAGPLREPTRRLREVDFTLVHGRGRPGELTMGLRTDELVNLANPSLRVSLPSMAGRAVHAVAGIGAPARFFAVLRAAGIRATEHPFPDHYPYTPADIDFGDALPILMTEKDAVKCADFVRPDCWYLEVTAVLDEQFESRFLSRLKDPING
jgi:tetraacyldisaccharide 4'-kinase